MYLPDECEHGRSILVDCADCEPYLDPINYGCAPFDGDLDLYDEGAADERRWGLL